MGKILVLLCASFFSMICSAASVSANAFLVQQYLTMNVAMYIGDPADRQYLQSINEDILRLDALIPEVTKINPSIDSDLLLAWSLERHLIFGNYSKGGYDTNIQMSYALRQRELSEILRSSIKNEKESVRAAVAIADAVANYLLVATSPVGNFNSSAQDSGQDLLDSIKKIDILMGSLKKYDKTKTVDNKFKAINAKWSFLRSALLHLSTSPAPFIVNYTGRKLINDLMTL